MRLLIVDDEPLIVEGLASMEWEKLNIDHVYKATSGEQALQIIESQTIDIVITDIQMPDMTGLELIASASRSRKRKYIILTGYADFEFAKQAIKLSVHEYLLKPVSDEELLKAVSKAVNSIKIEQETFNEIMRDLQPVEHDIDIKAFNFLYENPQLINLLDSDNWDLAEEKLIEVFKQLTLEKFHYHEFIIQAYFMICNTFTYYTHKNGHFLVEIIGSKFNEMHHAAAKGSVQKLREVTFDIFRRLKEEFKKEKEKSKNHQTVIDQVNIYVNSNLHNEISLQEAAESVYLHPAYLSKLYKAETGRSFSEFVYIKKMTEAANQLTHGNKKIYEIAMAVGYRDTSYFIRKFKEYFSFTPQEYRNRSQ